MGVNSLKRNTRSAVTVVAAALLLVTAMIMEMVMIFRMTSQQSNESGSIRLQVVSGELEETINEARSYAMNFALGVQPMINDRDKLEGYINVRKKELGELTNGVCYNAYVAGKGWYIIPDFDAPEDYDVNKRSWYIGATRSFGKAYVTDPYIDAATGHVCYTVSVMLDDTETVVALDYTMDNIHEHIAEMYNDGEREAVIVTEQGVIAGCSDENLVGKNITKELPDYIGIFSLAKSSDEPVHVQRRGENLFAVRSGFGWYLIVSENNLSLYKKSYIQMMAMLIVSITILAMMLYLYLSTARAAKKAEDKLAGSESFMNNLTAGLQEPLKRIVTGASPENIRNSSDYELEFENIREAGVKLSEMVDSLASYNSIVRTEKTEEKKKNMKTAQLTVDKHFKRMIIIALMLVFVMSMYVNITATFRWGKGQMKEELGIYTGRLTEWASAQKSIMDMFCSVISTQPEILDDYNSAVQFLDDITVQYPEISASFIANPSWEKTVIMNSGWEPDADWHVEDRDWYKQLESSGDGWCISAPYYDEQTGMYCVTFAERVNDARTGKYIGSFGIDFYLDKLADIPGSSYSDEGYAFITDAEGGIISHPYGGYRMDGNNITNVAELPYVSVQTNADDIAFIRDYDGKLRALMASDKNEAGFNVYMVKNIGGVYSDILLYDCICLVILLVCTIAVYMLMNNLVALQDKANRQLKKSAEAAIAADEAKSSFLAQMSHEIRTPINAVLGMNEMILRECEDDEIKEYAVNIKSAGRTLLSLINSILDFSKIEDGKMEIIPVSYGTASMINDLVTSVSARIVAKDLTFKVDTDPSLPSKLMGDDVRIKQVITNLLTNAVKYTEKGSVTLIIRGEEIKDNEIQIYVEVSDTGIGIKEEDIGALFESFRRLDEKRNRNIEGTGLGMSIVTKLLEMMGSELHVESIYGVGSTFWFRLKQHISDPSPMGKYNHRSYARREEGSKHIYAPDAKVLVVDDNEMNLKVAISLMKMYGIVPETAGSGYMALSMIREKRYDVILLDHMMPGMDGIETLMRITGEGMRDADTAIIALTANAVVGARESYLSAGFDDYLAKPIEAALLEKMLHKYLPPQLVTMVSEKQKKIRQEVQTDSFTAEELQKLYELCPSLNPLTGLNYCMGSREFYLDTLVGYAEADKRTQLQTAFDNGDLDNYRVTVHGIKSASLTIGAQLLSDHAKALEFAARDGKEDFIREKHEDLMKEYSAAIEGAKSIVGLFGGQKE